MLLLFFKSQYKLRTGGGEYKTEFKIFLQVSGDQVKPETSKHDFSIKLRLSARRLSDQ